MRSYATALWMGALLFALGASLCDATQCVPSPSEAPSPTPTPSDPCGGDARLLATSNRPTIGYSPCAVARNTAVFELGYQNEVDGTPQLGAVESQVPQNFLRIGVATRFEIDAIGPNYESVRRYSPSAGTTISGVADSGAGFKFELPPSSRWIVGFDGLYTGPNGTPGLTAGSATLTGNVDAAYALSSAVSLGSTIAVSSTGDVVDGMRHTYGTTMPSFVATAQIPHFYQFYAEYVYDSKIAAGEGGRAFTDFGVQKLLGTRTEIDVEYGHAFTGIAQERFNYIGSGLVLQLW
jgi:hypothetical protein